MRNVVALTCVGIVVIAGCQTLRPPGTMELFDDSAAMRSEVLKFIPAGTRVDQAMAVMKAHGFHCPEWAADHPDEKRIAFSITKPDPNASLFDRLDPLDHEIRVTLLCENGRVIDVKVDAYNVRN